VKRDFTLDGRLGSQPPDFLILIVGRLFITIDERALGKRVCGKPYRGFESHSLRHSILAPAISNGVRSKNPAIFADVCVPENVLSSVKPVGRGSENGFFSKTFIPAQVV
jgi:hypothetical protein